MRTVKPENYVNPPPTVLGVTLCEKVIVEEGTRTVTLVSCFTKLAVEAFPSPPQQSSVFATLTDGLGNGTIEVVATRLETDEVIRSRRIAIQFPERLTVVRLMAQMSGFSFPAPGRYQFSILMDGEWL